MARIFLAPGHGEGDSGAVAGDQREHDYATRIAGAMRERLVDAGVEVEFHPGVRDVRERLLVQAGIANAKRCDLAVQIHLNAHSDPNARGAEVWVYHSPSAAADFAGKLMEALTPYFKSRGVKAGSYIFVRATAMPAAIVEAGFLTNPADRVIAWEKAAEIGRSLADATLDYLKIARPAPARLPVGADEAAPRPGKLFFRVTAGGVQVGSFVKVRHALSSARGALLRGQDVTITRFVKGGE